MKTRFTIRMMLACSAVLVLTAGQVQAGVIAYEYTGSWDVTGSGIVDPFPGPPTAPFGTDYSATLYLDNGGMDPANQLFTQSDFVSATLTSGSYFGTMLPSDNIGWADDFTSNSLGQLGFGFFNAGNAAGDSWHFDNQFEDEEFFVATGGSAGYFEHSISNPGVLVPDVPEPTSLAIFGTICLVACGRRRKS